MLDEHGTASIRWRLPRRAEPVVEVLGQLGPHVRIVARDQGITLVGREPLELADRFDRLLGFDLDEAADRQLVLDVLGEVGGVEREDEAVAADRLVEFDDEALMPRGVPVGRHRRDARCDLGLAVGEPPVDARVVEVDPDDRVASRARGDSTGRTRVRGAGRAPAPCPRTASARPRGRGAGG